MPDDSLGFEKKKKKAKSKRKAILHLMEQQQEDFLSHKKKRAAKAETAGSDLEKVASEHLKTLQKLSPRGSALFTCLC